MLIVAFRRWVQQIEKSSRRSEKSKIFSEMFVWCERANYQAHGHPPKTQQKIIWKSHALRNFCYNAKQNATSYEQTNDIFFSPLSLSFGNFTSHNILLSYLNALTNPILRQKRYSWIAPWIFNLICFGLVFFFNVESFVNLERITKEIEKLDPKCLWL